MAIIYHEILEQGSDEWLALRCGMITASTVKLILTPTFKLASNDKERRHFYELIAQRWSKFVEPTFVSDDMLQGREDEYEARDWYSKNIAPVTECGLITNDRLGFQVGYSPDGLIGDSGQLEIKSRRQAFQVETILSGGYPVNYMLQIQFGLGVSEREWCDFESYSGGMPRYGFRVHPDKPVQEKIDSAVIDFEERIKIAVEKFKNSTRGAHVCKRLNYGDLTL